jgi:hypothetical protein
MHDCPEDKDGERGDYRPPNLAAVVRAQHEGRPVPVVGWDGEVLAESAAPWPRL